MSDKTAKPGRIEEDFCLDDFKHYLKMLDDVRGDLAVLHAVPFAFRSIGARIEELENYLDREISSAKFHGADDTARTSALTKARSSLIAARVNLAEGLASSYEMEQFNEELTAVERLLYLTDAL